MAHFPFSHFKKINIDIYIQMVYIDSMEAGELKRWREANGYSQARLAKALGVAVMTVSRWENRTRSIPSFLHLALRCLELEGGDSKKGKTRERRRKG